jgi:hypothetical protein
MNLGIRSSNLFGRANDFKLLTSLTGTSWLFFGSSIAAAEKLRIIAAR